MGLSHSHPNSDSISHIPPGAFLTEILDDQMNNDMKFYEGLIINIPVKMTHTILDNFPLEKKRYLQRIRRLENETNDIIVSYSHDKPTIENIQSKLNDLHISAPISQVSFPLWAPRTNKQREQCQQFWPLNIALSPPTPIPEPLEPHKRLLSLVIEEKSIIITRAGCGEVIGRANSDCNICDGHYKHGFLEAIHQASTKSAQTSDYLCTGFDVYCYYEPCCMCSMALTHSRIGRLFFIKRNDQYGGITSQAHIHCTPQLNHLYRAFQLDIHPSVY